MRWLYHKTLEPKIFEDDKVDEALSAGWVKIPKDAKDAEEPEEIVTSEEEQPKKFLSQMNVSELHDEGKKYGLVFTDETKSQMKAIISESRE